MLAYTVETQWTVARRDHEEQLTLLLTLFVNSAGFGFNPTKRRAMFSSWPSARPSFELKANRIEF